MSDDIASKKMYLDLVIIDKFHKLKEIDKLYPQYYKLISELVLLLEEQKKIDIKSYRINIEKNDNVNKLVQKNLLLNEKYNFINKLNLSKRVFEKHNYDCKLDIYNLFNMRDTPVNEFTEKWQKIHREKNKKSLIEFYNDRDWK